ncbi:hypothetical protein [Catalinimonas niigatensis]|uniref:hypothetical protein n=1 Tax=Catalinimonas niigatensis TaxID=1397264 RepID=UPI0026658840|nr:hypothetical protein [Catalinimonas niigatensis]WPP52423.1 hypothetical protein PZB72_08510 [Catalinimonas niigatensis]
MHKYLIKSCNLLILSACFLGGVLAVAYASGENYPSLPDYIALQTQDKEKLSFQEEGISHTPFASLLSSLNGIFSEPDFKRGSKDNPTHDFLHSDQRYANVCADVLFHFNPAKTSFSLRNRSIYLLDCAFLI